MKTTDTDNIGNNDKKDKEKFSYFECKICFEIAEQAVVTQCGHLYW